MARQNAARDWLVYIAIRWVAMLFQMFPINVNLRTARLMGWIWYRVVKRHRQRAGEHLRAAYGSQLSDRQMEHLALRSMQQMVMMAVETLFTPRLINEWTWPRYVRLSGVEPALELLVARRGAILVTGHYGNWEMVGFILATIGFPLTAVMRPLDNPHLNRWLMEVRARRGLKLLYKKGASQSADEILDSGGLLGFIADQNAGHKGLFVDFFGRQASTYKSIGLLAIRHRVPIIVGYARRLSERFEYEVGVARIIHPEQWAGQPDELRWITQEYTAGIEAFVRQQPEHYLWIHRRWKSRPKDECGGDPAEAGPEGDEADPLASVRGPVAG